MMRKQYGKGQNVHFLLGDFNARIIERFDVEKTIIGPHIFTEEGASIDNLTEGQRNNRERFVEFCIDE